MRVSGYHEDIIVVRRGGWTELVNTTELGIPLALDEEAGGLFGEETLRLEPGDGIVLYSDGITEAENADGEFYEMGRLREAVSRHWDGKSAEEIKQTVIADVRAFIGKHTVYDDITLLVVKQL